MSLQSKVAIVTGGNSGIGQAIVLELARQGANLVIDYVAHPRATEALEQQISKLGEQSIGVDADVSKLADLDMLIDKAVRAFGRLDIMATTPGWKPAPDPRHHRGPIRQGNGDQPQERLFRHPARGQADDQAGWRRPYHQHQLGA